MTLKKFQFPSAINNGGGIALVGKDEKATGPPSNLHPPKGFGPSDIQKFFTWNFQKKQFVRILKTNILPFILKNTKRQGLNDP